MQFLLLSKESYLHRKHIHYRGLSSKLEQLPVVYEAFC